MFEAASAPRAIHTLGQARTGVRTPTLSRSPGDAHHCISEQAPAARLQALQGRSFSFCPQRADFLGSNDKAIRLHSVFVPDDFVEALAGVDESVLAFFFRFLLYLYNKK
jgi:hypothetical protein